MRYNPKSLLSKYSCQEFETSGLASYEFFLLICSALMQGEEGAMVISRNDQDAGMQPVKSGQHPALVTLFVSCVFRNTSETPRTQSG